MKLRRKIYLMYALPALVIHELSHIIFLVLFIKRFRIRECKIDKENQHYFVDLRIPPLSTWMCLFVSFAPFISMLTFLLLGMRYDWCMLVFFYQLTTLEVALPSKQDVRSFLLTYEENK